MTVTSILWVWSSISNVEVSKASKQKKKKINLKESYSDSFAINPQDLFIMKASSFPPWEISNLQALVIKSMEKQPKTVKEGNFILKISLIFTSDLGDQAQVFILIYPNTYFSLNKEFLSLTARAGVVWNIWNT